MAIPSAGVFVGLLPDEEAFDYDSTLLRELKLPWFERKGRGRGKNRLDGRPLLPAGMWEFIYFGIDVKKSDATGADNDAEDDHRITSSSAADAGNPRMLLGAKKVSSNRKDTHDKSDWNCGMCMNTNWHWRDTCNKCNTARPVVFEGDGRVREGAGGGFNERQERVSTTVVEVAEDGFDDFGRRKDRAQQDKAAKEKAALERLNASYGRILGGALAPGIANPHHVSSSGESKGVNDNNSGSNYWGRVGAGQFDDRTHSFNNSNNSNRQDSYKSGNVNRRSRSRSRNRDRDIHNKNSCSYSGRQDSNNSKYNRYDSREKKGRSRSRSRDRAPSSYRR